MRVLYLLNSVHIGGGNRSLLTLWEGLRRHGIDATAVVQGRGAMTSLCEDRGIPAAEMQYYQPSIYSPVQTWRAYMEWRRLFRAMRTDIVHANDLATARSVCLAARRARIPLACHVRYPIGGEGVRWAWRGLPAPDVFIFNSHALLEEERPALARASPSSRLEVVHNGVSLDVFRPRRPHGPGPARVGIIANLLEVKRHEDFLEMAAVLVGRGARAEFLVAGEDVQAKGHRARLEGHRGNLGLEGRVKFLGHVPDVADLLQSLDVVVCASEVEPFGRCLIEAMACQVPVVATRVGGIPEVVEDGATGILVNPRAPNELADAVEGLLADHALRQRMGEAGRRRVEHLFSCERHAAAILGIYKGLGNH